MEIDLEHHSLPIYECLASETRLNILKFIGNQKKSIGDIAKHLKISNAMVTRHIQQMEDAGLLNSERGLGENRNKKMVYLKVDDIHINFPEKIYQGYKVHHDEIHIGHFIDFSASPTCGLATTQAVVGKSDDPKYFMAAERVNASLLWFSEGFVEYKIPNMITEHEEPNMLEISLEIASEFPISNNVWPSDISIYINDVLVAVYTVPGNFSDTRGRYTPKWWNDSFSQYGVLKHIRVNKLDTGIDGEAYSAVTIDDLDLKNQPFITLRLAVEPNAINKGGLTIFGEGFGNHNQGITINTYYLDK